ncbi:hypothetical protein H0H87_000774, partial [Tephrocybe sp. NHM501043]
MTTPTHPQITWLYILHMYDPGWLLADDFQSTQLVILQKNKDNVIEEIVVSTPTLHPDAPPLGYQASNAEEVLAWLWQERSGAFGICPPNCEVKVSGNVG